jgi:hypothetical protein
VHALRKEMNHGNLVIDKAKVAQRIIKVHVIVLNDLFNSFFAAAKADNLFKNL